jgi:hypothetical protein
MNIDEFIVYLAAVHDDEKSHAEADIIEISTIDTDFTAYDETDPVSVVQKYLKR